MPAECQSFVHLRVNHICMKKLEKKIPKLEKLITKLQEKFLKLIQCLQDGQEKNAEEYVIFCLYWGI